MIRSYFLSFVVLIIVSITNLAHAQDCEKLNLKKYKIAELSDSLEENSGLMLLNERLYTFNDGGNTSELFEINPKNGKIVRVLQTNLQNRDWEAITTDSTHIYIADIGNNAGSRKDLIIYKIPFKDSISSRKIEQFQDLSLNANKVENLSYTYPDQMDFSVKYFKNNYDAEAIFYYDNQLHLLSKEWASKGVTHYIIKPDNNNQIAKKTEYYQTDCMITDATRFENKIYAVGYTKSMSVYLMVFTMDEDGKLFNQQPQKYFLGKSFNIGQIEGVTAAPDGIYISGEQFLFQFFKSKQALYFVPYKEIAEQND